MKKGIFAILTFLVTISGFSQTAEQVLNKVEKTISSYRDVTLDFSYINNRTTNKGTLLLNGNKYNLSFMGVNQIYDGSKTYLINPNDEEVTISNHTKTQTFNLYSLIKSYKNSFRVEIAKKNHSEIVLDLIPTTKTPIKKTQLIINPSNYQILKKVDYFMDGSSASLVVNSIKVNQQIPADKFKFDKRNYSNYYFNYID